MWEGGRERGKARAREKALHVDVDVAPLRLHCTSRWLSCLRGGQGKEKGRNGRFASRACRGYDATGVSGKKIQLFLKPHCCEARIRDASAASVNWRISKITVEK